jgi:hypothetical protein
MYGENTPSQHLEGYTRLKIGREEKNWAIESIFRNNET